MDRVTFPFPHMTVWHAQGQLLPLLYLILLSDKWSMVNILVLCSIF